MDKAKKAKLVSITGVLIASELTILVIVTKLMGKAVDAIFAKLIKD